MNKFSKRQWYTLVVISIADFCNAICVSLQAPFYPQEAEKKGASATEYGLVFGVFELVVFIVSPWYGQHLNKIGPNLMFNSGVFTTGICAILFGLLDNVDGHYQFIILSFIIRIVAALGNAAFLTASFAIIAKEFPDNVATTFASLETFFGLGLIIGPTVGGGLFQLGGFVTPFVAMGAAVILSGILTAVALPYHDKQNESTNASSVLNVLKIPNVFIASLSIIAASVSIGFLQATLEPHLRSFDLSPVLIGVMFVINGGTYAITAPIWGWLCDKILLPKVATTVGCVLVAVGFSLIGPAPFIPLETVLWLTILGLIIHGLGMSAQLVSSFTDALRSSVAYGFPNNLETFGLISGLWTSMFALGAFIGPSISGILFDSIGFKNSSLFIVVLHGFMGALILFFLIANKKRQDYIELPSQTDEKVQNDLISSLCSNNITQSFNSGRSTSGISIEQNRPAVMNSLIACNSYKSKVWSTRQSISGSSCQSGFSFGPFNLSYGTVEPSTPTITEDQTQT